MDIYVDNVLWDKSTKAQTFGFIEFRKAGETLFGFKPLSFWDSNHNFDQSIATLEQAEGNLFIEIRVPYTWLQTAIFPVMIDADIDLTTTGLGKDAAFRGLTEYLNIFNATYNPCGRWNSGDKLWGSGFCFHLTFPLSVIIDACTAIFTAQRSASRDATHVCNSRIWAEDASSLADFSSVNATTFKARFANATSAVVDWDGVPAQTVDVDFTSPDFSEVLQEVVNIGGWGGDESPAGTKAGNFVFFWNDWDDRSIGDGSGTTMALSNAYDYYSTTTNCVRLAVDYSEGGWSNIDGINNISSASISKVNNVAVAGISKVHGVSV